MMEIQRKSTWLWALMLCGLLASCALVGKIRHSSGVGGESRDVSQDRWWSVLGPVLSHEIFSGGCPLCHVGSGWHKVTEDCEFDQGEMTGRMLEGGHAEADCLRCH